MKKSTPLQAAGKNYYFVYNDKITRDECCARCCFYETEKCFHEKCREFERKDAKNGYFRVFKDLIEELKVL